MSDAETDAFTGTGGGPAAKFTEKGKWVVGTILERTEQQEHDFATKEPLVWKDGSPRMQQVLTIQTEEHDDDDDTGIRRVYCKWAMVKAIGDAIKETGYQGPMVGGKVGICWSDDKDTGKGFPMKLYKAKFEPPAETGNFLGEEPLKDEEPF